MRALDLLCTAVALAALAVVTTRAPAQTDGGTYEACRSGEDAISASELPETVRLARCPVGERVLTDNGVGTVLPAPGQSIHVDATTTEGPQELEVTRYRNGTVGLDHVGDETEAIRGGREIGATGGPGECSDGAFTRRKHEVYVVLRGYYNPQTTPDELSRKGAVRAVKKGTSDITNTRNKCGLGDRIPSDIGMSYEGSIKARAQIGTGGNCNGQDRKSVISFGTLSENTLAVTCTESHKIKGKWHTKWSDIMLDKAHHNWTTRPNARSCGGKYDVESTVAHERGHTFGLDHVSESSHGNLTMSGLSNGPCQMSERSLGRGDVLGLGKKY